MQNQNNFQKGFLRVSVYDQTEGRPLNNVTVSISETGEGGEVMVIHTSFGKIAYHLIERITDIGEVSSADKGAILN